MNHHTQTRVGVIGAGAWGTAVAIHLALCGHQVDLWCYEKDVAQNIRKKHENIAYLPGITIPAGVTAHTDISAVAAENNILFVATPAQFMTALATRIAGDIAEGHRIILLSKGLRETDGALLTEVWQETCPQIKHLGVLSGPNFAREIAQDMPACAVLASTSNTLLHEVNDLFTRQTMRLYFSDDVIGVQVGGALKNAIAIAAGVNDGLGMGDNLRAAIICRGIAEMRRYGIALGAQEETIFGLSGVGDVMLTGSSIQSRNYRLGLLTGQGMPVQKAIEEVGGTVEGLRTARIVTLQSASRGIDLGVIMAVDGILSGDVDAQTAFDLLLSRPRVIEFEKHKKDKHDQEEQTA